MRSQTAFLWLTGAGGVMKKTLAIANESSYRHDHPVFRTPPTSGTPDFAWMPGAPYWFPLSGKAFFNRPAPADACGIDRKFSHVRTTRFHASDHVRTTRFHPSNHVRTTRFSYSGHVRNARFLAFWHVRTTRFFLVTRQDHPISPPEPRQDHPISLLEPRQDHPEMTRKRRPERKVLAATVVVQQYSF